MERILGIDFGSKTVGVAISDPLGLTAQGLEIIRREQEAKLRRTLARIETLIEEYRVERIILGFPRNMDNTVGPRAEKTLLFKEQLERRTKCEVILRDERLTTVEADRTLDLCGVGGDSRRQYIDQLAAVFILQGYLDLLHMNSGSTT